MAYQIIIDEQTFEFTEEEVLALDITEIGKEKFHLIHQNASFFAEITASNFLKKQYTVDVQGTSYEVVIRDEYDQLVNKMGLSAQSTQKLSNIKAPMPGLILDVLVKPGQAIEKGTQLVILEAMKMENILKADGEGTVKSISVIKGEAVDKGQVMIEME